MTDTHIFTDCMSTFAYTHSFPFVVILIRPQKWADWCVCVFVEWACVSALEREHGIFSFRLMHLCLESPYHSNTHMLNLYSSIHCFLLLIKADNLHCMQRTCTRVHTAFKRIFPFAQQTSSCLFSHLMPPLLADRWALENCCCLSDTSPLLSKWFI